MRTASLLFTLLSLLLSGRGTAQSSDAPYYFIVKSDTIFCTEMVHEETPQGYLGRLSYTDIKGQKKEYKGRKEVPDVVTFYENGITWDKIPQKANKPESYIRYTQRVVDGKLIVYAEHPGRVEYIGGGSGPYGSYRFIIKMPNGNYYKINDKGNMNDIIKPYLLKCAEFKNKYKGNFSTDEEPFKETAALYNQLCQ